MKKTLEDLGIKNNTEIFHNVDYETLIEDVWYIDNYEKSLRGNHPKNIIFLTADTFGVLPCVSKLD